VYLFKDAAGEVLYIGKAASLRSRVRSYFQARTSDERSFVALVDRTVTDVETIVTGSEKEATILENNLVKERRPRWNVKLRDDKDFLCLRVDEAHEWPWVEVVRRPKPDGARYFGPYHSAQSIRRTLRLVNRHFQLRTCTDRTLYSRTRPCLEYFIKRCPGMCVHPVDREWYAGQVEAVTMSLAGKNAELLDRLEEQMTQAAAKLEYERASIYRDQLRAVERSLESQRVVSIKKEDEDAWGLHREAELVEVVVLRVRAGRVFEERTFSFDDALLPDEEVLRSVVSQFYAREDPPDIVLVPRPIAPAEVETLDAIWTERKGRSVSLRHPRRGAAADLVRLANENAAHAFGQKRRSEKSIEERLAEVQRRLGLAKLPRRVECVDISHLGGTDTVASLVSLWNGEPDSSRTRTFHVRDVSGGDDYGAMREVLSRRFRRAKDAKDADVQPGWEPPDLLVVDGGRGQLAVATAVLGELNVQGVDVCSLAKETENALSEKLVDRAYLPGRKNPVLLRQNSSALFLLARVRDEAHRVAVGFQQKIRRRKRLRSGLLDVPGVGPRTARALLTALGSLRRVKAATLEQLLAVEGVTRKQAQAIRAYAAEQTD